jgi:hypothetical protein
MRMTAGDFRWTLKVHGDLIRQLTLLEIRLKARSRRKSRKRR